MRFSGGSHAVSAKLKLSEHSGALLHYKFTRGIRGLEYIAQRGQHAGSSVHYRTMLKYEKLLEKSPVTDISRTYSDSLSLNGLLR